MLIFAGGLLQLSDPQPAPDLAPIAQISCGNSASQEIVICGSRDKQNPYRLPKLPTIYGRKPLRAEIDAIPGVHTQLHAEVEHMPDGNVSKRLLLTFTWPF